MELPAYWWLLGIAAFIQLGFFVYIASVRIRGKGVHPLRKFGIGALSFSVLAGLAYGIVQCDPLFFLGQACLIVIYYRMQKFGNDD